MIMTRKYNNHKLQTNPRCHKEEIKNTSSHTTARRQLKQKGTIAYKLQASLREKAVGDGHGSHTALKLYVKAKEN